VTAEDRPCSLLLDMQADPHDVLRFLLLLALVIGAAKLGGWVSLRLAQPTVLGEILAGIALGPSFLDVLSWPAFSGGHLDASVAYLATLGVLLLMFLAGLETDLDQMSQVSRVAVGAGTLGVIAPVLMGLAAGLPFGLAPDVALFFGITMAATSVSITVQTLAELGRLTSKEGTALLGAAVVDDVLAILVLSLVLALRGAGTVLDVLFLVGRMGAFFVIAIALGLLLVRRGLLRAHQLDLAEAALSLVLVLVLLYAWSAEAIGQVAGITGAYLIGLVVGQTEFRKTMAEKITPLLQAMFVPLFFVAIGLQTNLRLVRTSDLPFALLVVAVAVVSKVVGCGLGARLGGFDGPSALRVGVGMVSRGEVGLIVASIGLHNGVLDVGGFSIVVLMVAATTLLTPTLLKWAFRAAPLPQPAFSPNGDPGGR